jgi:hypothetical protein
MLGPDLSAHRIERATDDDVSKGPDAFIRGEALERLARFDPEARTPPTELDVHGMKSDLRNGRDIRRAMSKLRNDETVARKGKAGQRAHAQRGLERTCAPERA